MRRWGFSVILSLGLISIAGRVFSQGSNSTGTVKWPADPPVGIGTQHDPPFWPQNALHIHFDPADTATKYAMIRLSEGDSTTKGDFGLLGLMPEPDTMYSSLSRGDDLILHEHQDGDIIITNFSKQSTVFAHSTGIRFATTPDSGTLPLTSPGHHDLERMAILGNGNVGIDLPPDTSALGLGNPKDQIQIGGGIVPAPGNPYPMPGLTMYGGNRFENMPMQPPDTGLYPGGGWRYISFNHWFDHLSTRSGSHRFEPMGSEAINFYDNLLDFTVWPYDPARGLDDFSKATEMQLTGTLGLQLWFMDTNANPYHHLFDIFLPGQPSGIRNTNGLAYFHTPVCITSDHGGVPMIDFTNLPIRPNLGDDTTWMLVVKGAALFQEAYVNANDWSDYVFLPGYQLPSLSYVEKYIRENHHLPDMPSEKEMVKNGVPLEHTEAVLTKKVEELTLYTIQLNKELESLKAKVKELKNQKGKQP